MRHPRSAPDCLKKRLSSAMLCRIVGFAICPSAPQAANGLGREVAIDEGQRDRRVHIGGDLGGAEPERFEQAAQLVRQLRAGGHQVVAVTRHSARGSNLGQTPASCGMTCRVGRLGGSLTDGRSWLRTLALHPVACLSLPAPRGCGSLRAVARSATGASPRGHRSRNRTSAQRLRRVKDFAGQHLGAKHGSPTAAIGQFTKSADRPPPWRTLRRAMPTSIHSWKVVQ